MFWILDCAIKAFSKCKAFNWTAILFPKISNWFSGRGTSGLFIFSYNFFSSFIAQKIPFLFDSFRFFFLVVSISAFNIGVEWENKMSFSSDSWSDISSVSWVLDGLVLPYSVATVLFLKLRKLVIIWN